MNQYHLRALFTRHRWQNRGALAVTVLGGVQDFDHGVAAPVLACDDVCPTDAYPSNDGPVS